MNREYWDYKNINELLDLYEFDIIVNEDLTLSVRDRQGANLGNIEEDKFNTFTEIIDRMEAYHYDYIVKSMEDVFGVYESDYEDWYDMYLHLKRRYYDKDITKWDIDMLGLICTGD